MSDKDAEAKAALFDLFGRSELEDDPAEILSESNADLRLRLEAAMTDEPTVPAAVSVGADGVVLREILGTLREISTKLDVLIGLRDNGGNET